MKGRGNFCQVGACQYLQYDSEGQESQRRRHILYADYLVIDVIPEVSCPVGFGWMRVLKVSLADNPSEPIPEYPNTAEVKRYA